MAQYPRRSRRKKSSDPDISRIGFKGAGWRDSYHLLMTVSVRSLLGLLAASYLAVNMLFASAYSLLGIIAFVRTIHARHTYGLGNLRWNMRLADILIPQPGGGRAIDYTKFHEVVK